MAQVTVNRDLKEYRKKVILGLTARQIFCFAIAGAAGFVIYHAVRGMLGTTLAATVMIISIMPIFILCLYEKDGRHAEKVLYDILRWKFLRSPVRAYETENIYAALIREAGFRKVIRDADRKKEKRKKH